MYNVTIVFVSDACGPSKLIFNYVTHLGRDDCVVKLKQDDGTEIMIPMAQIKMIIVKERGDTNEG